MWSRFCQVFWWWKSSWNCVLSRFSHRILAKLLNFLERHNTWSTLRLENSENIILELSIQWSCKCQDEFDLMKKVGTVENLTEAWRTHGKGPAHSGICGLLSTPAAIQKHASDMVHLQCAARCCWLVDKRKIGVAARLDSPSALMLGEGERVRVASPCMLRLAWKHVQTTDYFVVHPVM